MNDFIVTIGLEIHIEMNTKTKMFSASPVSNSLEPNIFVTPYDMSFPGTLPLPNKQAIINAIQMCYALNMNINNNLCFDRKNYFYSDLPKGYQITQDEKPIGSNGYLNIEINDKIEKIEIERLHLEEDTAKQIHFSDFTLVDYNRAGIPLLEIVSRPCIHSVDTAIKYAELIREIAIFLEISNGKMEDGNFRCDVNVSVSNCEEKLGSKVEIKNINSFEHMKIALNYEINKQIEDLKKGKIILQETKFFDEKEKKTKSLRVKNDSIDYKYFSETNIIPIKLSQKFINNAINNSSELASKKRDRYKNVFGINDYLINILLSKLEIAKYFDDCVKFTNFYEIVANWIVVNVLAILNKDNININHFVIEPKRLAELINDIGLKNISNKIARDVFDCMIKDNLNVIDAKKKIGILNQESDPKKIEKLVEEVINDNKELISDFYNGKSHVLRFLIGQVMKKSKGLVNPAIANKIMLEKIKKQK